MTTCANVRGSLAVVACLAAGLSSGCWEPPPPSEGQAELGLLYMLPGIDGGPDTMKLPYQALRDAGVAGEIRVLNWNRGAAVLENLTNYSSNLARSGAIAAEIAAFEQEHPGAPVDLVGYSGGGGLAILAAELLPDEFHVRNVLLVQAAVSPDYDLEPVLAHIDGKLVNFYSPADWLFLGWGTETFGTIDRTYTAAAGKNGFNLQSAVPDQQAETKVEQVCWTPEMSSTGHLGTHASMISYEWNKEYVAPYLLPAVVD
jgi:pimeloyl-ACP methyl ester carboxylesterase